MKVRFWGVRGSLPSPGPQTLRYGGNTSCLEVRAADGTQIILDAGTGIFPLAQTLPQQRPVSPNIFLTHTHWDHIQGLPFFSPFYTSGNTVTIHGPFDPVLRRGIERAIEVQLQCSYFPISAAELRSRIRYVTLEQHTPVTIGALTVTPLMLNHPVANLGYRIDGDGGSMFFTGDHEPWSNTFPPDDPAFARAQRFVDDQHRALDAALAGVQLLVSDGAYTRADLPGKLGWGHGTLEGNLAWARALNVRTLVCTHHEPTRTDDTLERAFAEAIAGCGYVPGQAGAPRALLAREGLELDVGP